jgi:hypothetical protein
VKILEQSLQALGKGDSACIMQAFLKIEGAIPRALVAPYESVSTGIMFISVTVTREPDPPTSKDPRTGNVIVLDQIAVVRCKPGVRAPRKHHLDWPQIGTVHRSTQVSGPIGSMNLPAIVDILHAVFTPYEITFAGRP